jgi:hypothetical protein
LKNVIWIEFRIISEYIYIYIYIAPYSVCDRKEPGDAVLKGVGELRNNCGCKGFTTSLLLKSSCTVISTVTLQGGDLLTQSTNQHDCCEISCLQFNIIQLSVDVIKYILFNIFGFYLIIFYIWTKGFFWNRPINKTVNWSSRENQVSAETGELEMKNNKIFSLRLESEPLNCSNHTKNKFF